MNEREIIIVGGNVNYKKLKDYIVFDTEKERIVETKELIVPGGNNFVVETMFGFKYDQETIMFFANSSDANTIELFKVKRGTEKIKRLYEIKTMAVNRIAINL